MVNGNALGEAMFYGQGAGKLPTASAVVADIIECMMHIDRKPHDISWEITQRENVVAHSECAVQVLVRLDKNADIKAEELFSSFGAEKIDQVFADEQAWRVGMDINNRLTEQAWQMIVQQLGDSVKGWIRFWQE
jgi:homoserine dehydrogenase